MATHHEAERHDVTKSSGTRANDGGQSSFAHASEKRGRPSSRVGPFHRGQIVAGSYEIGPVLGAGGMGVVYEAQDVFLDRKVAIKAPLTPEFTDALRKEAVAMAAVQHPNLVTIHAIDHEAETAFMVMERVFGNTLEDRIIESFTTGHPIPLEEALDILVAITDALTAIHRAGLTHRDVKSANVLLSGRGVVLADFGLAVPEVDVRSATVVAGTVEYMAPEVILNTVRAGSGSLVDLYALGVVAFELLTGRLPYWNESTRGVLMAHLQHPVPDVRAFRRDTPDELARLIRELLAKRPVDRPESSEVVLWRLQAARAKLSHGALATSPFSVLIVDDDPDVGELLKCKLEHTLPRLAVSAVTDSTKALHMIQREAPDIAVVDLNMPGMNGVELCMNVGAMPSPSRPVVVAMSGRCSCDDVAVLRALDVYDFVDKDDQFVRRMCDVIGDVRRARLSLSRTPANARSRRH